MLRQRSFKPAKCKTALKLAVSRIKLLKNKREAYLKQLRRELAQLLQSGHDHNATIRVEHFVREEKTIAAYDFIEIYCELIAARLPIIESQKKCPIDLKEAISSVIFASARCSDIPELMDVQKHIMAKYGKGFVASAVQLLPDCDVNCLLVEKLSAKAPDGPTKIKILTAIAEEHGVKWQPKQFGENDAQSSQDLVAGPNAFEKATYVEPPQVHVPPVQDEKGPPNLHAFYQLKEIHDIPTNSYEHSASVATRKSGGDQSKTSGASSTEIRSSVTGSQEQDFRDPHHENSRENWNTEFKDAVSAAQAAAESAEHASMAARAAVLLSNREKLTRWYSSGPHSSSGSESRGEVSQEYAFHAAKHFFSTGSADNTFRRSSCGKHNEEINVREQGYQSASQTSSSAFGNDNPFANGSRMADIYRHNDSFKQENSDEDLVKSVSRSDETENHVASGISSRSDEKVVSDRKSSSVGSDVVEEHFERKVSITSVSEKNFGGCDLPIRHASFSGRSSTSVSGYNRPPPNTKSKSVELEHTAFQNEQYSLPRRTSAPLKTGTRSSSSKDGRSSKASVTSTGTGLGWKSCDESENQKASTMSMMNRSASDNWASSEPSRSNFDGGTIPCAQARERPGHVHPKLPDYDSLTAYFLSLKKKARQ